MSRTTTTVPTTPRSRKAKSRRTDFVEVRYTCPGKTDIVDQWPRKLYDDAEKRAKAEGVSFEEYVNNAVRRQYMLQNTGGTAPLTVQFSPSFHAQLVADCDILGISVSEFLEHASAIPSFTYLLDFAAEYLTFNTRDEAIACGQRIVAAAKDETDIVEAIKRKDGRWKIHRFSKSFPAWHDLFRACEEVDLNYLKVAPKHPRSMPVTARQERRPRERSPIHQSPGLWNLPRQAGQDGRGYWHEPGGNRH